MNHWVFDANGLKAYVVVDRWSRGLAAGGLRFTPQVALEEVRRLASTMTLKWGILDLPFGGAKLGIRGNPEAKRKQTALQAFGKAAGDVMRNRIITGPDLGTDGHDISTFYRAMGENAYQNAADPLKRQGFRPTPRPRYSRFIKELSEEATGLAVARAALAAWERVRTKEVPPTVAIQGFGSVGRVVAQEMVRQKARVTCLADARGSLRDPGGLAIDRLIGPQPGIMDRSRLARGVEEGPREDWMAEEVDILVPASVPDAITKENVGEVRARLVVEAANIPVRVEAEQELH
ncbi:MAG: Glu/Leu/Phe/Val dehydrogenase dimerization domain-containing protein, partial [Thermoplasmata archaeon]|nr:Glu/Leu/Phe/Val dehydrogenase dimerization domain-containing protein [Thermoplasmata archaeon]